MAQKIKVGVVGCGQIAQIAHIPYLLELPQFDLAALCDLSPYVVDTVGGKYRVNQRYTDYHELVKQLDLDAVLVTNKNHAPVILAALEAGKHVIVEKPLAFNLRQADEVIRAAKSNRRVVLVAYMKRYDPAYQYALEVFKGMGKPYLVRMHDFAGTYQINPEIYDLVAATDLTPEQVLLDQQHTAQDMLEDIGPECGQYLKLYDILLHLTIHDINVLQGAFGIPKIKYAEIYDELFMNAVLEFPGGVKGMWESGNMVDLIEWDEQIWVYGRDKRVEVRFPFPYLKNATTIVNINQVEGTASVDKRVVASFDEAFKREWRHFYECVTQGAEPLTGVEEARRDIEFSAELLKAAI